MQGYRGGGSPSATQAASGKQRRLGGDKWVGNSRSRMGFAPSSSMTGCSVAATGLYVERPALATETLAAPQIKATVFIEEVGSNGEQATGVVWRASNRS